MCMRAQACVHARGHTGVHKRIGVCAHVSVLVYVCVCKSTKQLCLWEWVGCACVEGRNVVVWEDEIGMCGQRLYV